MSPYKNVLPKHNIQFSVSSDSIFKRGKTKLPTSETMTMSFIFPSSDPPLGIPETPIVVTWVTFSPSNSSQVVFWLQGHPLTNSTAFGSSTKFVDGGRAKVVRYIHRVRIAATVPLQVYGKYSDSNLIEYWGTSRRM